MAVDRVPLADWEAIAAMPGLESLAEVFEPFCRRADPLSLLIFTAAQWSAGSRNRLHSWFAATDSWELVRASAARVGRSLPVKPPTQDQLDKLRREMSERDATVLMQRFAVAAREVTEVVGLLPEGTARLHHPDRRNVVYADGSRFDSLSGVFVDKQSGEVRGSRSRTGRPRVSPFHETAPSGYSTNHVPIVVAGVHGGERHLQCVLGIGTYPDMDEESTAMAVLRHVHDVHGSRMHAMFYDRLLSGRSMQELMLRGVVPIVDMKDGGANGVNWVPVPEALRSELGTRSHRREKAQIHHLASYRHQRRDAATGTVVDCRHELWTLDNAVVDIGHDTTPRFDHPVAEITRLWFDDDRRLHASFQVPCVNRRTRIDVELSAVRDTRTGTALADHVRPLQVVGALPDIRGWRSSVESVFAHLKQTLPHENRMRSLKLADVMHDLVGAGLWINAVAWDVHGVRHTRCAQKQWQSVGTAQRSQRTTW